LVRGTLIGGGLLGVYVGVVALVPHWYIQVDGPRLLDQFISPFLMISGAAAGITILIWLVLIGVAGLVDRKGRLASLLLVAIVLIGGTSLNPMDVAPLEAQYILAVMTGVAAALIFWTFDLFTLFVAGWMTVLYLTVGEVWLVTDHPSQIDWYLLLIWTGLVVGVGLWGALRPERSQEAEEYVPGYIQELALQERMQRELEIAHQVQGFFLPRRMPDVPGVDLSAMCLAAQEVGGDYYDVVELDGGRLGVVIGDVSGKGIQAAFFMTLTKGFLQTLCRTLTSPAEVLRNLNTLFFNNVPRGTFISMIYGVLDVEQGTFTFARAGHNPVIVGRGVGRPPQVLQPPGLAIGLSVGPRFDDVIEEVTITLRPGDVVVLYTDGFSEAMDRHRELYGDDRLADKVAEVQHRPAAEVLRMVTEDVHRFVEAAGRQDDMTMMVLKLLPVLHPPSNGAEASRTEPSLS
ncbi:MAG: PP2C family protein-serine/threonine phosphatase, partial [Bacteroidota bacterium]